MSEKILELAAAVTGAGEADLPLLEELCKASGSIWAARLRDGLSPESCEDVFNCAAAFSAAAVFFAGQEDLESFTAGDVSVKIRDRTGSAAALQNAAERLMAPFASPADLFLKGVPG